MRDRSRRLAVGFASGLVACAAGTVLGITHALVGGAMLASAGAIFVLLFGRTATRHTRLVRALTARSVDAEIAGQPVRSVPLGGSVFVAGLARPRIYGDPSLVEQLAPDELEAVVLHERAHQVSRDPLRAATVAAIAPLVGRSAAGHRWLQRCMADREIAADRFALDHGVSRRALAAAMLKVPAPRIAHAEACGFTSATEQRMRALLGSSAPDRSVGYARTAAVGALLGAMACVVALHPVVGATGLMAACC